MNKVILMGRLTKDPDFRYAKNATSTSLAIYTLAVPREFIRDGEQEADFIRCITFGRLAEFAEKYFFKGIKILVTGRLETGSYTKPGTDEKVYTTTVIVEKQEFAESRAASQEYLEQRNQKDFNGTNSNNGSRRASDTADDSYYGDMVSKAFGYERTKSDFKSNGQSPKPYKPSSIPALSERDDVYAGYNSNNPWGESDEEELDDELPF